MACSSYLSVFFIYSIFLVLGYAILQAEASSRVFRNLQTLNQPVTTNQTYRTSYHFQPPSNWMNDPNGPMVYNGIYHLFYQYNPNGPDWGNIVWGHSTSQDLVNWTNHDPAIRPTNDADINGCYSGSVTILPGDNKPAILYTGIDPENRQVQNLAVPKNYSDPLLKEWIKSPYNPLMEPSLKNQIRGNLFRDPSTAWLGPDDLWRVIIGNELNGQGRALVYRSNNFTHWIKADHTFHSANGTGIWECPDFFPVSSSQKIGLDTSTIGQGIKHILKISFRSHDYYMIGTYNNVKDIFVPEIGAVENGSASLRYDYGKFYASKTFYDSLKKRRILWSWINESLPREDYIRQGWSGIQAVPRVIWLDKSGEQLLQWPIVEIESLRGTRVGPRTTLLQGGSTLEIRGITAAQADVEVSFEISELKQADAFNSSWTDPQMLCSQKDASTIGGLGPFGLKVLASRNLEEYTSVFFRIFRGLNKHVVLMCSDQSRSSLNPNTDKTTYGAFLNVDPRREHLALRILIDHSIIENFGGNGKACITSRVYPTKAVGDQSLLYLFNGGMEDVKVSNFSAWSMRKAHIN